MNLNITIIIFHSENFYQNHSTIKLHRKYLIFNDILILEKNRILFRIKYTHKNINFYLRKNRKNIKYF